MVVAIGDVDVSRSIDGATDGSVQAEFIHVDDFMGGVELLVEAARSVPDRGNTAARRRFGQIPEELRERLRETVDPKR